MSHWGGGTPIHDRLWEETFGQPAAKPDMRPFIAAATVILLVIVVSAVALILAAA